MTANTRKTILKRDREQYQARVVRLTHFSADNGYAGKNIVGIKEAVKELLTKNFRFYVRTLEKEDLSYGGFDKKKTDDYYEVKFSDV